jgi:hypothetical protein
MTHDFEHWAAIIGIAIACVTPLAHGLMKTAHLVQKIALSTASKRDDEWAAKLVYATESFCGFVTKVSSFLPRVTMGRGVSR